ncbi:hypothetical protein WK35_02970 [Burkholderia vietnamiensis]|jgi:integrating conjugative element protein (TIGR03765 family)|uniref:integrating conjugative element protein n=1 Tax=Burkholderia cepacia complex TaxID=87882 RepID=UPI0007617A8C|nr:MULTISPECIES: integrating conjugative element protein [Burkholderia cepacia complex]KVS36306.1 hypothetical protein WK35_02970 [Burkholderia vietnamiensis]MBU9638066.1 integrating conjugative element protein [Burkholderia multivorans]PRF02571.1 integrating conjugative element protein [Burkholderia multivorans]PRG41449.1 integrating conjugative element protein [Burkholderia multivorans]
MNRTASVLALGLLASTTVYAQNATSQPIVVEDRGGISALPYYQALNPQNVGSTTPPAPASRIGNSADAEAAMLPVHSTRLSPGNEPRRVIRAPGLTPLFLVGDDDRSRAWLRQHQTELRDLQAVGLVVNVVSVAALASLRRLAPGLVLSPASADDLAQRLGIRHYPVLITATGIEP